MRWQNALVVGGLSSVVVSLSQCSTQQPVAAARGTSTAKADRLALVVGIDHYDTKSVGWGNLKGCRNDARLAKVVLERCGFPATDILLLEDEQATHAAVVRAFYEHLILRAKPDSQVVFWYCGHGSRVPDVSEVEASRDGKRMDSTLVLYDSRAGHDGEYDFCDDEINSLMRAVPSRYMTVITDSCHSGGVTRGGEPGGVREATDGHFPLDLKLLAPFWPKEVELLDDDAVARAVEHNYIHLSACSDEQLAREWKYEDETHGVFTWHLSRALLDGGAARETWRDLARRVHCFVTSDRAYQTPWSEGPNLDVVVFKADKKVKNGHPAMQHGGVLEVQAGRLMGIEKDMELELFRGELPTVGKARVVECGPASARLEWVGSGPKEDADDLWARAVAGTAALALPTMIEDPALAKELADSTWIRRIPVAEGSERGDTFVLRRDGTDWVWRTGEGLDRWRGSASGAFPRAAFEQVAQKEARFQALWRLAGTQGALTANLDFALPSKKYVQDTEANAKAKNRELAVEAVAPATARGASGAEYGLALPSFSQQESQHRRSITTLEILASTDANLTVLCLNEWSDGKPHEIVPLTDLTQHDRRIAKGEPERVPVWIGFEDGWPLSAVRPARERYIVILTKDWVDFSGLIDGDLKRGSSGAAMPAVLQQAAQGQVTRGGRPVDATAADGWGVQTVDMVVQKPPAK